MPDGDGIIIEINDVPLTNPSTNPSTDPSTNPSTNPATDPATNPSTNPSTNPATDPATNPSTNPATDPATNPSTSPSTNPNNDTPGQNPNQSQDKDFCEKHPDSLACLPPGSLSDQVPKNTVPLNFSPEPVSLPSGCPADIPVLGQALSFAPACQAMEMLRPFVIGAASLIAGFILVGAFRD
jgi:hypothetical protein